MKKKYKLIYADPPWAYKVWSKKGEGRSAESHYKTMSKEDIQNIPVADWCEDDAVLLLWVTAPCLIEGIELIEKWGFTYKTVGFTWAKMNVRWKDKIKEVIKNPLHALSIFKSLFFFGMGYYTRANTEFCLLATRGKPLPRLSHSVRQLITEPIREHSRKPDRVRGDIVELFGDIPRLEMFARTKPEGWDVFGNEVNKYD